MTQHEVVGTIWLLGGLVLVGSALIARRLPVRRTATLALVWLAIFAVGWGIARLRQP